MESPNIQKYRLKWVKNFNYFIGQAYSSWGDSDLDGRLARIINHYDGVLTPEECAKKFIVCENFENYAQTGGVSYYYDREGNNYKSLEGMARWKPQYNGETFSRSGGVGTFHMEYEYKVSGMSGNYPFLRNAIQIMNPAKKINGYEIII